MSPEEELRFLILGAQREGAAAAAGGLGVQPQDQHIEFRVIACGGGDLVDLRQPGIGDGPAGGRQAARLVDLAGRVVLLAELDAAGGTQSTSELAQKLGLSRSRFLLQLIPLEKIGLVERIVDENGTRRIKLRPAGCRQQREARSTAADVCRAMLAEVAAGRSSCSSGCEAPPEFR